MLKFVFVLGVFVAGIFCGVRMQEYVSTHPLPNVEAPAALSHRGVPRPRPPMLARHVGESVSF